MTARDDEYIAELLSALPPAPAAWVAAALEIPRTRRELEDVMRRVEADEEFRRAVLDRHRGGAATLRLRRGPARPSRPSAGGSATPASRPRPSSSCSSASSSETAACRRFPSSPSSALLRRASTATSVSAWARTRRARRACWTSSSATAAWSAKSWSTSISRRLNRERSGWSSTWQHSQRPLLGLERDGHEALGDVARALGHVTGEAGVPAHVLDHQGLARGEHPARDPLRRREALPQQAVGPLARDRLEDEPALPLVEEHDRGRARGEDRPRRLDDRIQQPAVHLLGRDDPGGDGGAQPIVVHRPMLSPVPLPPSARLG